MVEARRLKASSTAWWIEWHRSGVARRVPLTGRLTVGRSRLMGVVIDDPYVSREHCVLQLEDGVVRVDASLSVNLIVVDGREMKCVVFRQAGSFSIGQTVVQLRPVSAADDATLQMSHTTPTLTLRRSTRELLSADGTLLAQLSASEAATLDVIASRFPNAADQSAIARAISDNPDYPSYLIHRLVQRLRDRMGDYGHVIENVRGAGYRLRGPLNLL